MTLVVFIMVLASFITYQDLYFLIRQEAQVFNKVPFIASFIAIVKIITDSLVVYFKIILAYFEIIQEEGAFLSSQGFQVLNIYPFPEVAFLVAFAYEEAFYAEIIQVEIFNFSFLLFNIYCINPLEYIICFYIIVLGLIQV